MRLVLDASAAIKWFVAEDGSEAALGALEAGAEFVAPDILPFEVASVLLRKERRGEAPSGTAGLALGELARIGFDLVPHGAALSAAASLAVRHRCGLADCLYLVVAQERGLPVATFDKGMRQVAQSLGIPLWAANDPA